MLVLQVEMLYESKQLEKKIIKTKLLLLIEIINKIYIIHTYQRGKKKKPAAIINFQAFKSCSASYADNYAKNKL